LQNWTIEQWFRTNISDASIMVEFGLNHSGAAPPICPPQNTSKSDLYTIATAQLSQRRLAPPHPCLLQNPGAFSYNSGDILQLVARWEIFFDSFLNSTTSGVFWSINGGNVVDFGNLFGVPDTNASYINSMNLMLYPQGPLGGMSYVSYET
jgi:hypothetical protein